MSRELLTRFAVAALITFTACSYTPPEDDDPTPDGPPLPEVFFDAAISDADENVSLLRVKVRLSEPSTSSVDFKVTGGTALPTNDFAFAGGSTSGTLTFAGAEQFIELTFSNDGMEEPDETIELTLENPQGATLGAQSTHLITISSDILPRVKFTSTVTDRDEDIVGAKLDLELDFMPTEPVSVDVVLSGSAAAADYGLTAQTVNFAVGQQTAQLDYEVVADLRDELDEIIAVDLANAVNAVIDTSASHTEHTIKDDDATPTVFFVNTANTQGEAVATADQVVRLSAPSNLPITVDYAITGGTAAANDVTFTAGTLTFTPGDDEETLPLAIVNDNRHELASETVQVTLSNPNANVTIPAATAVHTLTITDNDAAPTLSFAATPTAATEGNANPKVTVTVTLVGVTDLPASVDFTVLGTSTAVDPGDFTIDNPTDTLTFAPGVTTQDITFTIANDAIGEADETINLSLSNFVESIVGPNGTHTVNITDDDCLGSGAFRVCPTAAPAGNKNLNGAINTDTNSNCAAQQPAGWLAQGQPEACFVIGNNVTVQAAGIQVTGSRPLVLVAATLITVSGVLDASGQGAANGPAGPSALCKTPTNPAVAESSTSGGGGGAGGSFMTKGGNGGDGNQSNPASDGTNAPNADGADPTILRGGCAGAPGGGGTNEGGPGGGAGGAVYLVAPTITITNKIDVSGGGGIGGVAAAGGGGGGGSGGSIFLDALTTLNFSGTLMSNGGGAGQGADNNTAGDSGGDPTTFNVAALGGSNSNAAGDGGNGFATGSAATAGSDGPSNEGAGGGGGGGGFIKSTKSLAGGDVSAGKTVAP